MLLVQPSTAPTSNPSVHGRRKAFADDDRDQRRAENVSQCGQQKTSRKVFQGVAKVEFQPAFEQHKNDGQGSQQVRRLRQRGGLHQAQHGAEQHAQHHQHEHIRDAGQSKDAVGQKGHHQQTADQSQNQRCGHSFSIR